MSLFDPNREKRISAQDDRIHQQMEKRIAELTSQIREEYRRQQAEKFLRKHPAKK